MSVAYFDCFSGASGDMILGALIDLGVPVEWLEEQLRSLKFGGFSLSSEEVSRGGFRGRTFSVVETATDAPHAHERGLSEITDLIEGSDFSPRVKESATRIFRRLAEAEARVHGTRPDNVHFHEVGAVDSIIDVIGACLAIERLQIDKVFVSAIAVGSGTIECRHGTLPVPAPATAELLQGAPVMPREMDGELTTPTGAAILTGLADDFRRPPLLRDLRVGWGAGKRDNKALPNLLRVFLGEEACEDERDEMYIVETNLDDVSGELCGYLFDKLLAAGAVDVFTTPIQMKKSRPGILLSAIVPPESLDDVKETIFDETRTFGVREYLVSRTKLAREHVSVSTQWGDVRGKVGRMSGNVKTASPEYEDCKRVAEEAGVPLKDVYRAVQAALQRIYSSVRSNGA